MSGAVRPERLGGRPIYTPRVQEQPSGRFWSDHSSRRPGASRKIRLRSGDGTGHRFGAGPRDIRTPAAFRIPFDQSKVPRAFSKVARAAENGVPDSWGRTDEAKNRAEASQLGSGSRTGTSFRNHSCSAGGSVSWFRAAWSPGLPMEVRWKHRPFGKIL
jgi:hypothetical protein